MTLDLTFPDPYQNNTDLSGKDVTFEVTVLSKTVENVPELTDQFVAENYEDYSTVEALRAAVADSLEQDEYCLLYTSKGRTCLLWTVSSF